MPRIQKVFTLEVSPEQFLNACDSTELQELEILLSSTNFQIKKLSTKGRTGSEIRELLAQNSSNFDQLFREHGEFSIETFGRLRGPEGPISHLKKEIEELLQNPGDKMEYADCLLLLMDAWRLIGGTSEDMVAAAYQKLQINRKRKWGTPDENGVVEHVREERTCHQCRCTDEDCPAMHRKDRRALPLGCRKSLQRLCR